MKNAQPKILLLKCTSRKAFWHNMEKELTRYALKSGYLEKVGHFRKTWKKRLFVLTSSEISYIDGESVKGKIPLEMITDIEKAEVEDKRFCLFIKTASDFNKDYTLSFDNDEIRDDWMKAIAAAKENKPVPDSVNRAFIKKNEDDVVDDSKAYFNRMLTAFGETMRDDSFQDVVLRLSSFFNRVAFTDLMSCEELLGSCDQVRKMAERIRQEMQRSSLMTQDVEHLFNDLNSSISYAHKVCEQKQLRTIQYSNQDLTSTTPSSQGTLSDSVSSKQSSISVTSTPSEGQSRGTVQHGFSTHYDIKETLGSGAYSVVYACVEKITGQRYAVKCIKKRELQANDVESLKNEVFIMGRLDHKNIVRLEGFYDDKDYYYIVTELVDGGELFEKIVEKKYYNENEARSVVKTLVETIGYCHKLNIAHRDLKPENILVDSRTNDIKIADFGFAKSTSSTDTGRLVTDCGSPWYVAPEILKGHMYGTEVDMWSLGVIIYILLCGYPPFHDSNQPRLFKKIRSGQYRFDSPYWDNVSDQAKDLIRHLLVVDPTQRYDAKQVLAHEWFKVEVPKGQQKELGSVIHELRTFNNQRKGIIKQGYLTKQGHFIRNWKKRSFVLMRDELRYYKSETEKKPQGKIRMQDIVELEDDPNDSLGFVIKTMSGKDFNINALNSKEKEDWMVQINGVKRCFLMRKRAEAHIPRKNYRAVGESDVSLWFHISYHIISYHNITYQALELIWEARNDRNMMSDPNLLQLWGRIAEYCEAECGAMYMVESVEESMDDNVSVLVCCNVGSKKTTRLVAGDFQGNVVIYGGDYSILAQLKPHKNMVTAISAVNKIAETAYVATGAVDGSVCVLSLESNTSVFMAKEFKRSVSTLDMQVNVETGVKRLIAADREGHVIVWDLNTKKKIVEKDTDCGNVRCFFNIPQGDRYVIVCESGAVLVYNNTFEQVDFFHVDAGVLYAKMIDTNCVMVATDNKEIVSFNIATHCAMVRIKINTADEIRCFDLTADGKYAVVVSNEIQFWRMSNPHMEANLSPVIPVRCMCLTGDFVSFFMSQDTHIEKWVIDWKISHEGKKYYPPLTQIVGCDYVIDVDEESEKKDEYKGTIETVNEEEEEDSD